MFWAIIESLHKEKTGELKDSIVSALFLDFYQHEEMRTSSHRIHEAKELEAFMYANALLTKVDGLVSSDRVKENIKEINLKSESARESANARWDKHNKQNNLREDANAMRTQCERNANKGKERKGKERKEYGEFNKVLLSEKDHTSLVARFGENESRRWIKTLDEGIEMKGYKYKNHYLAILKWAERETETKHKKNRGPALMDASQYQPPEFVGSKNAKD